jgi:hypothetical protein
MLHAVSVASMAHAISVVASLFVGSLTTRIALPRVIKAAVECTSWNEVLPVMLSVTCCMEKRKGAQQGY